MKRCIIYFAAVMGMVALADETVVYKRTTTETVGVSNGRVVNTGGWSEEAIRRNPYGFVQAQIAQCNTLREKIENQTITLIRLKKQATRKANEAEGTIARYEKFLTDAKAAYKKAEADNKWPANVNGFELDRDEIEERINDALERVELAQKERKESKAIEVKTGKRLDTLKARKRESDSLRRKLVQQAEQIKMNSQLAEIDELRDVLGLISDMMLDVDEDPTKLSLDDLTAPDPNDARRKRVADFLNN